MEEFLTTKTGRHQDFHKEVVAVSDWGDRIGNPHSFMKISVIPVKTGIQGNSADFLALPWIPAFAGMTGFLE